MSKRILGLVLFIFLLMDTVYARDFMGQRGSSTGDQESDSPLVPPQSAIDACTGKSEGATCQGGEARSGVCNYTSDGKYFSCKSNNRPSEGRRGSDGRGGSGDNGVKDNQDGTVTGTF